jgi:hypothetical protein
MPRSPDNVGADDALDPTITALGVCVILLGSEPLDSRHRGFRVVTQGQNRPGEGGLDGGTNCAATT